MRFPTRALRKSIGTHPPAANHLIPRSSQSKRNRMGADSNPFNIACRIAFGGTGVIPPRGYSGGLIEVWSNRETRSCDPGLGYHSPTSAGASGRKRSFTGDTIVLECADPTGLRLNSSGSQHFTFAELAATPPSRPGRAAPPLWRSQEEGWSVRVAWDPPRGG
jgi:hypothetical protein